MGIEARRQESHHICAQLPVAGTVLAFMPLLRWEPDIRPALRRVERLVLPRVTPGGLVLHACELGRLVRAPRYGILEPPADAPLVAPTDIDTVLVPGWAFSAAGERLGKGGGYYDRLLPTTGAARIGVCFRGQVWTAVPTARHDVPVQAILTADGLQATARPGRSEEPT